MAAAPSRAEQPPPRRRRLAFAATLAATLGVAGALLIGATAFLSTRTALELVLSAVIAESGGHLSIDGAEGSLLSSVRMRTLAWRSEQATVIADDVAITWSPLALLSRGIVVEGLGARRIGLTLAASDAASPLPATLALPTRVAIDRLAVGTLEWKLGTSGGTLSGIEFGYTGGSAEHRVEGLSFVTPHGTIRGSLAVDARAPYATSGAVDFTGDAMLHGARAEAKVSGSLAAILIDATARMDPARGTASVRLTPFAAGALDEITLALDGIDLAGWDPTLPKTRLALTVRAKPAPRGLAGRVEATNAMVGAIDEERLPVASLAARVAWDGESVALDEIAGELAGGGRVTGSANLPVAGGAGRWRLAVRDVDARRLYAALVTTRLTGTIEADLAEKRQRVIADLADRTFAGGVALTVAATLADRTLDVERLRARAAGGELVGSGRVTLDGGYAFRGEARTTRLDPSRFGAFPRASLDARLDVTGAAKPAWQVAAAVHVDKGSRLEGVALDGEARANVSRDAAREVAVDLRIASAAFSAHGGLGGADDRLAVDFDAPRLDELAPLLPSRAPRPVAGSLHAKVVLSGGLAGLGADVNAEGRALRIGPSFSANTLDVKARIAASPSGQTRPLDVAIAATDVTLPGATLGSVRASGSGTLDQHRVSIAVAGPDLSTEATAHGALHRGESPGKASAWQWSGTLDTLENRGTWPVRLAAPAAVEVGPARVHLGATQIAVGAGRVAVASLAWDDGRLSTRGEISAFPAAMLARLAGRRLPSDSTMTLGGEWSLDATPRLNGSLRIGREGGDLLLPDTAGIDAENRPLRISAAELSARIADDAVDATAFVRSDRGARVDARLAIGALHDAPPGIPARDAPMELTVTGELSSLRVLQPWVGTTAIVDGRVRADLALRGTVAKAPLSGSLSASALTVDAPQYGIHFKDGRLEAQFADRTVSLETLSFAAGAGRFEASGTLAVGDEPQLAERAATGRVNWRAEQFRVLNRPGRLLVASGSGTLSLEHRKLSLAGSLTADQGHFDYTPDATSTLGADVVVKGRPQPREAAGAAALPLTLDVELDLGRQLRFVGEGLDTGLRGKVRVTTGPDGTLQGHGSIRAMNGTYHAFGQTLAIDRGQLIFDGPLDNPGLDIVALRKNLPVEAGVIVSGTVAVPIVQLTSQPPVPDNEKLSWLVLGQGLDRTSGADMVALQAAAAAMFGSKGRPVGTTIANQFGLDDISVRSATGAPRGSAGGTSETTGQVVAIGKRISDRLSLIYEQGLTVATNALRLEYQLTRTLTLRAEAGAISGFGVFYRQSFE